MNLLLVADGHYFQTPDGIVYADSVFDYTFYKRYLQTFDQVYAVVRARKVEKVPNGKKMASGEGVSFLTLPIFHGPFQYVMKYLAIRRDVNRICNDPKYDCAIFRLPASTANIFAEVFSRTGKPFAVEIVTDPWVNFGPRAEGIKFLNKIYQREWTNVVKKMCTTADGASYVTERYLQELYNPRAYFDKNCFTSFYSSVELADDTFGHARIWRKGQTEFIITHASNYFNSWAKGQKTVMLALKKVREDGYNVKVQFIGDGPLRGEFERTAKKLGVDNFVNFLGRMANGDEVRKRIADSDMLILPTYAEGLPRVLLEAMSVGLPCLSSPICGIPEILKSEYLFDFDDYEGFAKGIERFVANPDLMTKVSSENLQISQNYRSSVLNQRRKNFFDQLKNKTLSQQ